MITEETADVTVTFGQQENASFSCTAIGEPLPNITWFNGTVMILETEKYNISITKEDSNTVTSTLLIMDPRPDDSGVYTCNVSNFLGYSTSTANLTVNGKYYMVFFL